MKINIKKVLQLIESQTGKKIMLVESEDTIKNPETGRNIKVSSALSYPKDSKVYKLAMNKQTTTKKDEYKKNIEWFAEDIEDEDWNNINRNQPTSINFVNKYFDQLSSERNFSHTLEGLGAEKSGILISSKLKQNNYSKEQKVKMLDNYLTAEYNYTQNVDKVFDENFEFAKNNMSKDNFDYSVSYNLSEKYVINNLDKIPFNTDMATVKGDNRYASKILDTYANSISDDDFLEFASNSNKGFTQKFLNKYKKRIDKIQNDRPNSNLDRIFYNKK